MTGTGRGHTTLRQYWKRTVGHVKAVILAGGEGEGLHPLSLGTAPLLLPLLGRPLLEHTIGLLKRHGFADLYVVLDKGTRAALASFGDGSGLGVRLTWVEEERPLGSAGSVKNCLELLGEEDFLVIRGNCLCDLDLGRAARAHRERGALATLVLCRSARPGRSLVTADDRGRVEGLGEVPIWDRGEGGLTTAGVCILSPAALEALPAAEQPSLGRDLFPALLKRGAGLYSVSLEGCCLEVENCGDYLECVCRALDGRLKVDMGLPQRAPGVWSADPVPKDVTLVPPCWIGAGAELGQGCLIGPHTVVEAGAGVGERAMVQRSVLHPRAWAGPQTTLYGAVLCREAAARRSVVLNEGAVLGANALAEEGAVLLEGVCLWPGQTAPAGCRLRESVTSGSRKGVLRFGEGGAIPGVLGEDLGPEGLLALGSVLGEGGRVVLGCTDSPGARMLARAAAAGVTAAGGTALTHGLDCPVQAAWLAGKMRPPACLFVEEGAEGQVYLHLFDTRGLPLEGEERLRLERALAAGEFRRVRGKQVGRLIQLKATAEDWARETARQAALGHVPLRRVTAAVEGDTPESRAVREALLALGCRVEDCWRPGIPAFSAHHGGLRLTARDERGALLDGGQLLALVVLIEMENGSGKAVVSARATAAVELVASGYRGRILRLGRDGDQARTLWANQPWMWSAPAAAARICARMGGAGQSLETLISKTPRFSAWQREVPITTGGGRVLQALARERGGTLPGAGLRLRAGEGWVQVTPLVRRAALRVMAEGPDLELAAELCDFYAHRAECLDRQASQRDAQGE